MVRLSELVEAFGGACALGADGGPEVRAVALDSRAVERGTLFAALEGERADGARFVPEAVARGAPAVLAQRALADAGVPLWVHPAARALVGPVAARLHGEPARGMFVVGVTGTNGKTTVAHLAAQLLAHCGRRPGLIGTVGNTLADGVLQPASHTTPDAPELWRLIARHRELGGDALVLEVSSHALAQSRTSGLAASVAIFTNLTRDHLDYHGTMQAYARAKQRLFESLAPDSAAVVHAGDPHSTLMAESAARNGARVITYGVSEAETREECTGSSEDLRAVRRSADLRGTSLTLSGMGFAGFGIQLPLLGRHNVENALAATAAVLLSGASPSTLVEGLATVFPPPGRMERVPTGGRGFDLFVDYAHTEAALDSALRVVRDAIEGSARTSASAGEGRLLLIFGCGGERDRGKRAPMGRLAAERADVAIVTSDNPRGEDPERIIAEILAGVRSGPARAEVQVEPDRRAAIRLGLSLARPGDALLIAGKGHETEQVVGSRRIPFDDRAVAAQELG